MAADDDAEFTEFMRQTSGRLLTAAYLLTGDRSRAEDLAQTAFARTYAAWPRVRRKDAYAYARKVLVNATNDWWRRRPWREQSVEALPDSAVPADSTGQAADRHDIAAALSRLTRRERTMVVLRYYSDMSEADVANELGVNVGTVKSTTSRALAKLRSAPELLIVQFGGTK